MNQTSPTDAPVKSPNRSFHVNGINGLRGAAALIIVIYHLFTNTGLPEWRPLHHVNLLRPLHDGWCGVSLFLVISGFCLFWPYARDAKRRLDFKDFMTRRAWRLLPAYYASLIILPLVSIPLARWGGPDFLRLPTSVTDVVLHLLLLHSLTAKTINSMNEVAWSLGLEWIWYLAFPLAVWTFRRAGAGWGLFILGCVTVFYRLGLYFHYGPAQQFPDLLVAYSMRNFLLGRLLEFALGMYVAWWMANRPVSKRSVYLLTGAIPILLFAAHSAIALDNFIPLPDTLFGLAFASLVFVVASQKNHLINAIFASRFLSSVGEYSYSLYLFHMIFVQIIKIFATKQGVYGPPKTFFLSLLSIPIILVFAKIAYLCFEKPFLKSRPKAETAPPMRSAVVIAPEMQEKAS